MDIYKESFQKIRKMLNFQKANLSTKNFGRKVKLNRNSRSMISENFDIPRRVVFSGNSENAVPFVALKRSEIQSEIFSAQ